MCFRKIFFTVAQVAKFKVHPVDIVLLRLSASNVHNSSVDCTDLVDRAHGDIIIISTSAFSAVP